jgi:hypothetical protein
MNTVLILWRARLTGIKYATLLGLVGWVDVVRMRRGYEIHIQKNGIYPFLPGVGEFSGSNKLELENGTARKQSTMRMK